MRRRLQLWLLICVALTLLSSGCDSLGADLPLGDLAATATAAGLPQSFLQDADPATLALAIAQTQTAAVLDDLLVSATVPASFTVTDTATAAASATAPATATDTAVPATATPAATASPTSLPPTTTATTTATASPAPSVTATEGKPGPQPPDAADHEPPCNAIRFVADVTVPDGSAMPGQQEFYKVWRVQNVGSCTWSSAYAIRYHGGFQMGAPADTSLGVSVAPGQYTNLGLKMFTPAQSGTFRSEWMLVDESGSAFGIGEDFDQPLFVEVYVSGGG